MDDRKKLFVQLFNIHGLIRGSNLELGKDSDTGGQTKYVLEFAKALSQHPHIEKVEILTRYINDKNQSSDYSVPVEHVNDKLDIIRLQCGGAKYIRKELLWDHLEEFVDKTIKYIKTNKRQPDLIHSHYADAGYVCTRLTRLFGIPMIHTSHSLGKLKRERLIATGFTEEEMEKKYAISKRINVEHDVIFFADKIITSTREEIHKQYGRYENINKEKFSVIPPGISLDNFYPFNQKREWSDDENLVRTNIRDELWKFFTNMYKPIILALCRPDKTKNINGLIEAYGTSKEVQEKANLAIYAGIRKDIQTMPDIEREVLTDMLLSMDKYNLYGKMAIPKTNDFEYEVPELYRLAAETQGVYVNSSFSENFGITLIEAASSGLPIVATDDGGPRDIIDNLKNGILVDVRDSNNISKAILKILDDKESWKKYSDNGISRVNRFYLWDVHTNKYVEMVNDLLFDNQTEPKIFLETGRKFLNFKKLIILDIDDTITGDAAWIAKLKEILVNMDSQIGFGVATGRTIESAIEILKEIDFLMPDVIISSVGSEIYYKNGDEYFYSTSWDAHIKNSWQPDKIKKLIGQFDFMELQEPEAQRKFKVSYNLIGKPQDLDKAGELIRNNKIKTNLIVSHGTYIDFLPFRASKGRAIRYLSYRWNIPLDSILVGGDSGNDEDMLTGELLGVVVANHTKELEKLKGRRRIYFAPHKHALGIVEGIIHYNFMKGVNTNND
jgi:sucrose-phosphate synthase